jgi:hypothetical protein
VNEEFIKINHIQFTTSTTTPTTTSTTTATTTATTTTTKTPSIQHIFNKT